MNKYPVFPVDQSIDQTNYYWFANAFTAEELKLIDELQGMYSFEKATTVESSDETVDVVRKSNIKWLHHNEHSDWVYNKLEGMVMEANQIWKFDIHSIIDSIQYTEYYGGGGHYDWHMDIGPYPINHRKISITIQLSEPEEYVGGDLELWTGNGYTAAQRQSGVAVLFPSYMMHRVTPVVSGTRKSLVLWVGGASYR